MHRWYFTTLSVLAMTASVFADPPQRAGLRPTTVVLRRPAVRPPPPAPPPVVPVQLAGLRTGTGRGWNAVMHAIQRDAWAALNACATPASPPRGLVHVELAPQPNGARAVRVTTPRRDTALESCVRRAASRIIVPPSEEDVIAPATTEASPDVTPPPEDVVAFDVAYGMPRLTRR